MNNTKLPLAFRVSIMTARQIEMQMDWIENVPEKYRETPFVVLLRAALLTRLQAIGGEREMPSPSMN